MDSTVSSVWVEKHIKKSVVGKISAGSTVQGPGVSNKSTCETDPGNISCKKSLSIKVNTVIISRTTKPLNPDRGP